ncbi:MAG: GltB/FmdC/FwdC-like GXGXG domain-containing protein [Anaerolineae bacterium]
METANNSASFSARGLRHDATNRAIRDLAAQGYDCIEVHDVLGHRFIGTSVQQPATIDVYGTPGEDLGAFMDGPVIRVFGNAQNAIGNTMNAGRIVVHGSAGDVAGHSMRGGQIWVRGNVGYRVGIHMKASGEDGPVIIVGGSAGDFLGEYMAGGVLIVLGLENGAADRLVGNYLGTGMHGGVVYVRGRVPDYRIGQGAGTSPFEEADRLLLRRCLEPYCAEFGFDLDTVLDAGFTRLAPLTCRPYRRMYASSVGEL